MPTISDVRDSIEISKHGKYPGRRRYQSRLTKSSWEVLIGGLAIIVGTFTVGRSMNRGTMIGKVKSGWKEEDDGG